MKIKKIALERLIPADYNPRKALKSGDPEYEKLKRSIQEFGNVEPLIWNETTGNLVGGHQRLTVLKELGYLDADCVVVELEEKKEKALNIALNKIQGKWDNDKLAQLITELDEAAFDVSLTGFDGEELDELMGNFTASEATEDKFNIEDEKAKIAESGPITKLGDFWTLGRHRLMCGDSAKSSDIEKLMQNKKAQMAMTCPPFANLKEYQKSGIENWLGNMKDAVRNISKAADVVCWNMGDMYNTGTQFIEPTAAYSVNLFAESGLRPIWIRIWRKTRPEKSFGSVHLSTNKPMPQYEYISAFATKSEAEYADEEFIWLSAFAGHSYKFVKRLSKEERKKWGYAGIWEMNVPKQNRSSTTAFPVELPWRCIKLHSDRDGIVLEPFCGSGTTLIAAEQTDRICYAMELEPSYCDLTVKRWEEFTGEKAVFNA